MKAIRIHQTGGPEALQYEDAPTPQPAAGEALVRLRAIGVNFIDVYFRTGLYKADPPFTPGMEGAGVVEATGSGVTHVKPGDRVAYAMCRGSYAEYASVPAWQLVPLPGELSFEQGAAAMLQGMTAHYLARATYELRPGDTCLVHAAAGGVGLLLVQIAKICGARVIGTAGTAQKAALAKSFGADEVILYNEQDFASEVRRLTGGAGVDVVYDSVGAATFEKSVESLRPRGMMVSYGNASGAVPPVAPLLLSQKGSLFLTRPTLAHYCAGRDELEMRSGEVLGWIAEGRLRLTMENSYALADAAQAHRDLEARKTVGKVLLKP